MRTRRTHPRHRSALLTVVTVLVVTIITLIRQPTPATAAATFSTTIAAGNGHTVVLKADGTVWTFGYNSDGQLGRVTPTFYPNPMRSQVIGLSGVTAISAGYEHTVALNADGTLWTFGNNSAGQLGRTTPTYQSLVPGLVSGLSGVTAIAAGFGFTVALKSDGTVWTFGHNTDGQLGRTTSSTALNLVPGQVTGLSGVIAVAAGSGLTVALKSDGTVWTFGNNGRGQLGRATPTTSPNTLPGQVTGLSGVTAISAGSDYTIALKSDGTVWSFGNNFYGALGRTTPTTAPNPVSGQVTGLVGVTAIAAGHEDSVVLKSDGTVWTFGYNGSGELGRTTPSSYPNPVASQVTGLVGVTAIAAGYEHAVALKSDGTVSTFGNNFYGALGRTTPTTAPNPGPGQVLGLSGVAQPSSVVVTPTPQNTSGFTPNNPARLLDTRAGGTTIDALQAGSGIVPEGVVLELRVAGRGPVLAGASAVALNMTVTATTSAGYLTVWPCGTPQPNTSNLNFTAGQTIANLAIAKIGTAGNICISVTQASAHIIADVEGQYGASVPVTALTPARLLDTRPGGTTIDHLSQGGGIVRPGDTIALPVINRGGSGTNVGVVALNVTVTGATGPGYVTVWPCGTPRPNASSLNYDTSQTIANFVITKPGPDGTVCLAPAEASTHILADIAATGPSGTIDAITPVRLLDTRLGTTTIDHLNEGTGSLISGVTLDLPITGRAGIGPEAATAILNITITAPAADGYLTVWPCGQPQPNASNINFVRGQTIPNNITTKIGANGRICLSSTATTHIIADVTATA